MDGVNGIKIKIRHYVINIIGDGKSTSIWHDTWGNHEVLGNIVPKAYRYAARMDDNLTVADMIENDNWLWPNSWVQAIPMLAATTVPKLNNDQPDKVQWKKSNGELTKFSVKTVWEDMRNQGQQVKWNKLVWYSQGVPRHSFLLWLAIKERLHTQDRLMLWNPNMNLMCQLCSKCNDSHNHLFFNCDYSKEVWRVLKRRIKANNGDNEWRNVIDRMSDMPCNINIRSVVRKMVLATCVYHIWRERNARIFTSEKQSHTELVKVIEDNVRLQLLSIQVKKSKEVEAVAVEWGPGVQFKFHN
ncbi:reverse transcriptase zinc-binding domain-containing protein [Artemisia annua]|uniref:Reverse transcriptase zinc-binding domain-containing protein n=1 Tax=Artemisia annua TaxID=35608 RepID=A0A2U1MTK6_ARTAN|nr:reverse transcriptase zinc-binding domain-containing protein [Artemisia annua]